MGTFGVKRASDESFCPSTVPANHSPVSNFSKPNEYIKIVADRRENQDPDSSKPDKRVQPWRSFLSCSLIA